MNILTSMLGRSERILGTDNKMSMVSSFVMCLKQVFFQIN